MDSYGVVAERIHVLPFVAPRYLHDGASDEPLSFATPPKFLFYPAQFWTHKNHERLLRALAAAKSQAQDIFLVLVGSKKNNYARIEALIGELGLDENVVNLGYVENRHMGALYRRARALVMPTFFGPTNIPPLEAFACGCPVAAADVYGMREQVGNAGLLFNPSSVDEIADALIRLWNDDDLHAELVRKSRAAAERWGAVQFGARLLEIVESVRGRRPARE
jgi:glycosyltransferase involved in cell wall biosynthesis